MSSSGWKPAPPARGTAYPRRLGQGGQRYSLINEKISGSRLSENCACPGLSRRATGAGTRCIAAWRIAASRCRNSAERRLRRRSRRAGSAASSRTPTAFIAGSAGVELERQQRRAPRRARPRRSSPASAASQAASSASRGGISSSGNDGTRPRAASGACRTVASERPVASTTSQARSRRWRVAGRRRAAMPRIEPRQLGVKALGAERLVRARAPRRGSAGGTAGSAPGPASAPCR